MSRYLCIHGHFYQPERENPWLEAIERQESAYPYHDWNARVAAECYRPNAASRILDGAGRIVRIVNNYSRISFNVGPTLLAWLESEEPETYQAVLEADRASRERFAGHGSAMAQVYNHMILPLACPRDRRTQVRWGLRDFERRFGRPADGMWLPETAVDLASLEALAEAGVRFIVLAPHQAGRVRPLNGEEEDWEDVTGGRVDPTRPYLQRLPSGREIACFFYDGPVSRSVAFEGLLRDGERFADRLLGLFREASSDPQLVHIATDGETYGHHHRHGEMALSYALEHLDRRPDVQVVNYSRFLALHPPEHEVDIVENTSWSCAHGVERWRSDCGCSTGGQPGWRQGWREPLREALDWLRDRLAPEYERRAGELLDDPWAARDDYIDVVLDRTPENVDRFLVAHGGGGLSDQARVDALELLELQRMAMLMYTSCGWFFNDLSGIETVQVIEYAGRAVQLAEKRFGDSVEAEFLQRLDEASSNVPEQGSGRDIYLRRVAPQRVDLSKVCAHHALTSLFVPVAERSRVYCYAVEDEQTVRESVGRARLLLGIARVCSRITGEAARFGYSAFQFGDHHVQAGVREFRGRTAFDEMGEAMRRAFRGGDMAAALRLMDEHFAGGTYSLKSLFRDAQQRIVERILESTLADVEGIYGGVFERSAPLMRFVADLGLPQPRALKMTGEFVLNETLRRLLREKEPDLDRIASHLETARAEGLELDAAGLALALQSTLGRLGRRAAVAAGETEPLRRFDRAVELALMAPFDVSLWEAQTRYWRMWRSALPEVSRLAEQGDEEAARWTDLFERLGEKLGMALDG